MARRPDLPSFSEFIRHVPFVGWRLGRRSHLLVEPIMPRTVGRLHQLPPYDFYTNSVIEQNNDSISRTQYPLKVISCIVNVHHDSNLYAPTHVNWFIPDIDGWLSFDEPNPAARLLERDIGQTTDIPNPTSNFLQIDGCLEYGNQGLTITAPLFGDIAAEKKAEHEHDVGCHQAAVENGQGILGINGVERRIIDLAQPIFNHFPSSVKYPGETMLRLKGDAGIKTIDSSTYISYFTFVLVPLGTRATLRL